MVEPGMSWLSEQPTRASATARISAAERLVIGVLDRCYPAGPPVDQRLWVAIGMDASTYLGTDISNLVVPSTRA